MKTILIAEDEAPIRELISYNLKLGGYNVIEAENGLRAIELYGEAADEIDVVLLDIMMPLLDGLEVLRRIRLINNNVGIVMVSAKTQEMDKVNGLLGGADDYISKPFSPAELMARVDAVYRRVSVSREIVSKNADKLDIITHGDFVFNLRNRTLTKNNALVDLTQVEFQIMELFFTNPNAALERKAILDHVWGTSYYGDEKVVDVNIRRLRMKLEDDPSNPRYLTTIWGIGYKWIP
ncbi:MAG: response regulator transcription factor [Oscillospiraceae bacterium]|nr:response regulator transcription factor [Oscillospiraceae bacterium]